jgi:hypothetical protein
MKHTLFPDIEFVHRGQATICYRKDRNFKPPQHGLSPGMMVRGADGSTDSRIWQSVDIDTDDNVASVSGFLGIISPSDNMLLIAVHVDGLGLLWSSRLQRLVWIWLRAVTGDVYNR